MVNFSHGSEKERLNLLYILLDVTKWTGHADNCQNGLWSSEIVLAEQNGWGVGLT